MSNSVVDRNRGNYPVTELPPNWKKALVTSSGNLSKAALQKNIEEQTKIPQEFLDALKVKYPSFFIPTWTPLNTSEAGIPLDAQGRRVEDGNASNKRKFTWLTHEWAGDTDEFNKRNADGTLIEPKDYTGKCVDSGEDVTLNGPVPDVLHTDEMIDHWNAIHDINGRVFYDAENLALGSLDKSEYFIVPNNWKLDECPIEAIGAGLNVYQVPIPVMAAIYVLAKQQAAKLNLTEDDQVKWAVLRLEAYKAGWFAGQKYTMYQPAPTDCMTTMLKDTTKIKALMKQAYALCAFLPFITEYHFRAFGSGYNKGIATEYVRKANELAVSATLIDCLAYMNQDDLYGRVLGWIGVKRPMQVLRDPKASLRVPNPFRIRAYSAPSEQAIITTSIAVINSIKAAGWWESVKRVGGYDDAVLLAVGAKVAKNPWKYHLMHHVYGEDAPTDEDARQAEEARSFAQHIAPILQAYTDTVMKQSPLGRIQALRKHAFQNSSLYQSARGLFLKVCRARADTIQQVFKSGAFQLTGGEG